MLLPGTRPAPGCGSWRTTGGETREGRRGGGGGRAEGGGVHFNGGISSPGSTVGQRTRTSQGQGSTAVTRVAGVTHAGPAAPAIRFDYV